MTHRQHHRGGGVTCLIRLELRTNRVFRRSSEFVSCAYPAVSLVPGVRVGGGVRSLEVGTTWSTCIILYVTLKITLSIGATTSRYVCRPPAPLLVGTGQHDIHVQQYRPLAHGGLLFRQAPVDSNPTASRLLYARNRWLATLVQTNGGL